MEDVDTSTRGKPITISTSDGEGEMTEDEVNKMVQEALQRARRAMMSRSTARPTENSAFSPDLEKKGSVDSTELISASSSHDFLYDSSQSFSPTSSGKRLTAKLEAIRKAVSYESNDLSFDDSIDEEDYGVAPATDSYDLADTLAEIDVHLESSGVLMNHEEEVVEEQIDASKLISISDEEVKETEVNLSYSTEDIDKSGVSDLHVADVSFSASENEYHSDEYHPTTTYSAHSEDSDNILDQHDETADVRHTEVSSSHYRVEELLDEEEIEKELASSYESSERDGEDKEDLLRDRSFGSGSGSSHSEISGTEQEPHNVDNDGYEYFPSSDENDSTHSSHLDRDDSLHKEDNFERYEEGEEFEQEQQEEHIAIETVPSDEEYARNDDYQSSPSQSTDEEDLQEVQEQPIYKHSDYINESPKEEDVSYLLDTTAIASEEKESLSLYQQSVWATTEHEQTSFLTDEQTSLSREEVAEVSEEVNLDAPNEEALTALKHSEDEHDKSLDSEDTQRTNNKSKLDQSVPGDDRDEDSDHEGQLIDRTSSSVHDSNDENSSSYDQEYEDLIADNDEEWLDYVKKTEEISEEMLEGVAVIPVESDESLEISRVEQSFSSENESGVLVAETSHIQVHEDEPDESSHLQTTLEGFRSFDSSDDPDMHKKEKSLPSVEESDVDTHSENSSKDADPSSYICAQSVEEVIPTTLSDDKDEEVVGDDYKESKWYASLEENRGSEEMITKHAGLKNDMNQETVDVDVDVNVEKSEDLLDKDTDFSAGKTDLVQNEQEDETQEEAEKEVTVKEKVSIEQNDLASETKEYGSSFHLPQSKDSAEPVQVQDTAEIHYIAQEPVGSGDNVEGDYVAQKSLEVKESAPSKEMIQKKGSSVTDESLTDGSSEYTEETVSEDDDFTEAEDELPPYPKDTPSIDMSGLHSKDLPTNEAVAENGMYSMPATTNEMAENIVEERHPEEFFYEDTTPIPTESNASETYSADNAQYQNEPPKSLDPRRIELRHPYPLPPPATRPRSPATIIQEHTKVNTLPNITWKKPPAQIKELLSAATGDSVARRSNACGAIKVLVAKKENQLKLVRTNGLLDALVFAANQSPPANNADNAFDARTRAVASVLYLCAPVKNRALIFGHPGIPECLVKVMREDFGEARVNACSALAVLAKTPENRGDMVRVQDLVSVVTEVVSGKKRFTANIVEEDYDDSTASSELSSDYDDEESLDSQDRDHYSVPQNLGTVYSQDDSATHSQGSSTRSASKSDSRSAIDGYGNATEMRLESAENGAAPDDIIYDTRPIHLRKRDEYLAVARMNSSAVLTHLARYCPISAELCRHETLVNTLVEVSLEFSSPVHTRCIEILCHLTRFPSNNNYLAHKTDLIEMLIKCGKSKETEDRIWALRTLQNLTSDGSSKLHLASCSLLTLLSGSAMRKEEQEQLAAVGALLNLSTEPGTIVPLTNTKSVLATLVHLAHNPSSLFDVRRMACSTLSNISLWLQTLALKGTVPEGVDQGLLPTHTASGWQRWE